MCSAPLLRALPGTSTPDKPAAKQPSGQADGLVAGRCNSPKDWLSPSDIERSFSMQPEPVPLL